MKRPLFDEILRQFTAYFRGVFIATLNLARGVVRVTRDAYYDKRLNIETGGEHPFHDTISMYKDGEQYQPAPYSMLRRIAKYLRLGTEDKVVDLGCGQGRAVFFLALHRPEKITGIDINKELIDIACGNLADFRFDKSRIAFVNTDAARFRVEDENVFILFNPFGKKTLQAVLGNIKASLRHNPRPIRIVYYAPACRDLLDSQEWLVREAPVYEPSCLAWSNKV